MPTFYYYKNTKLYKTGRNNIQEIRTVFTDFIAHAYSLL